MFSAAQPKSKTTDYDPYVYAFMRACGYPREYYYAYLHELGLRKSKYHPSEYTPPLDLSTYRADWLTPRIRSMALLYTDKPLPPPSVTAAEMEDALRAVEDAPDAFAGKKSGLTRRLQHAQARHWAAIIASQPLPDPHTYVDNRDRPVSELVAEARAARHASAQRRAMDRHRRKVAQRREQARRVAMSAAEASYHEAHQAYVKARAAYHVARDQHLHAQAERRIAEGVHAKAPRAVVAAMRAALADYRMKRARRRQLRAEVLALNLKG